MAIHVVDRYGFWKDPVRPATLILLLWGITKGESTARIARELGLSRQQLRTLREQVQMTLHDTRRPV